MPKKEQVDFLFLDFMALTPAPKFIQPHIKAFPQTKRKKMQHLEQLNTQKSDSKLAEKKVHLFISVSCGSG